MSILSLENVFKRLGDKVILNSVSLSAEAGEIIAISGGNGAGKSTFIKILASILPADSGRFSLLGITNPMSRAWKEKVAWVPQELALDDRLSARDHLKFWASVSKFSRNDLHYYLEKAYSDPLISEFLDKKAHDLSGGMKRRTNLISSIFLPADLILLDEPFVGADAKSQTLMQEKISELAKNGALVIFVSHEVEHVRELADRIIYLEDGHFYEND